MKKISVESFDEFVDKLTSLGDTWIFRGQIGGSALKPKLERRLELKSRNEILIQI